MDARRHRPRPEAGFTLVELMVVLTIMGLIAGAVLLTAPPGGARLASVADQFGARLVRAKEEAILTNRIVAVSVTPSGYAFRSRTPEGWRPLESGPFRRAEWGPGVVAEGEGEVRFEPTGQAEPLEVVLSRQSRRIRVAVDAAGNVQVDGAG